MLRLQPAPATQAQCEALSLPGGTPLLKRGIVQTAVRFPLRVQRGLLRWRWIQAIGGSGD